MASWCPLWRDCSFLTILMWFTHIDGIVNKYLDSTCTIEKIHLTVLAFEIYGFSGSFLNILYIQENVKVVFIFVSHIHSLQWERWNNQWWWSDISVFLFIKLNLFTPCICDLIQISQCLQQFCLTELPVMKEMFCAGATFGRYLKWGSWDWETEFLLVFCFNWCKLQQPHGASGYRMGRAGVPVCAAQLDRSFGWAGKQVAAFPLRGLPCHRSGRSSAIPCFGTLIEAWVGMCDPEEGRGAEDVALWDSNAVHTETWRLAPVSGLPTTPAHATPSPCLSLL